MPVAALLSKALLLKSGEINGLFLLLNYWLLSIRKTHLAIARHKLPNSCVFDFRGSDYKCA